MCGEEHSEVSGGFRQLYFALQVAALGLAVLPGVPLAGVAEQVVGLHADGDHRGAQLSPHLDVTLNCVTENNYEYI